MNNINMDLMINTARKFSNNFGAFQILFADGEHYTCKTPIECKVGIYRLQYMKNHPNAKVEIKGYASPEGSKEINERISQERADAVKAILVKKYKIAENRLKATGMGATDKLFEQVEFNRVATFNDITKD